MHHQRIVLATPAPVSHRTAEENLGLGYLAAVLRQQGYSVEVIDGWLEGLSPAEIARRILSFPSVLWAGFACYRSNMERALHTIRLLKQHGSRIPIVVGGYGPTFHTAEFLKEEIDIVVRGEGEQVVLELSQYFATGSPALETIAGISFQRAGQSVHNPLRPLLTDIDTLPLPAHDTLKLSLERRSPVHILSSRGCAAHCLFCSIVSFMRLARGPQWRQRSISSFVDELERLAAQGARFFKVIDDSFLEPPRDAAWCSRLADEVGRRGLQVRLRGSIRADRVNEEIVGELARAGFFAFSCGIENFAPSALARMQKTATLEQNIAALDAFHRHGIYIQAGHILFDYGTTLAELWQNLRLMRTYIWTISKGTFTEMFAAEGTPYTRLLGKKGLLEADTSGLGNHTYPVLDPAARRVYYGLKHWHKAHIRLYDKTIDAISAPKALEDQELALFHPLCIQLRAHDLDMFEQLLRQVEGGASTEEVQRLTQERIQHTRPWYETLEHQVDEAYRRTGLIYDAEDNPFVC